MLFCASKSSPFQNILSTFCGSEYTLCGFSLHMYQIIPYNRVLLRDYWPLMYGMVYFVHVYEGCSVRCCNILHHENTPFDPLKPHFYLVKLGFTGVHIISLISAQKHRLWVLVRTASPRRFLRVLTIYVLSRNMKNITVFLYLKIFIIWR